MISVKALKGELKKKTDKSPEKFYAVSALKENGFHRERCEKCGKYFWTSVESKLCGDPECSGSYTFIDNPPTKKRIDFIQVWQEFSRRFKKLGYTPIKRYPVVARWRNDVYWTNASIYDFQPHVVSGAVEPPANPLVVPQVCVRFNDIDNVGITGRHHTSFVMIGQHAFEKPKNFNRNRYLADIFEWLDKGMGIPLHELKFHEDQWAGGGNLGVCMEFFARGLELGNQVYMNYEITPNGYKDLELNVLDMGMGQERFSWLSYGTATSYEINLPSVLEFLCRKTGVRADENLLRKFLPYSGLLNFEETENLEKTWDRISEKIGTNANHLKAKVLPLAALYSVADHTRTLLFAVNDGALPSNIGGAYNLRVILRRALSFMEKYNWDLELGELCEMHAKYLKPQYPELLENLSEISKILEVEKKKFLSTREKSRRIIHTLLKEKIPENKLIELYDSHGITPEFLQEEAKRASVEIRIPEDFYAKVAARHAKSETALKQEEKFELQGVPDTEAVYFKDYQLAQAKSKVLKVINGKNVILDKTVFFPTGGGQLFDVGTINGIKVLEVKKQGNVIIHILEKDGLKLGQSVEAEIDIERRIALAKNHTSAHIIGGAARKVLGKHIWQAGSQIEVEKGRLDITHFENLTSEEREKIEELSNRIINENRKIKKEFIERNKAEQLYGFTLYQGGAVPGKKVWVVNIENWDTQACCGTHLNSTGEAECIQILKTEKIQDGVVRIIFTAGKKHLRGTKQMQEDVIKLLENEILPLGLKTTGIRTASPADIDESASLLRVPKEQFAKTIGRFASNISLYEKEFGKKPFGKFETLPQLTRLIFERWKELKKKAQEREAEEIEKCAKEIQNHIRAVGSEHLAVMEFPSFKIAMSSAIKLTAENPKLVAIISAENKTICCLGKNIQRDARETLNILLPNAEISEISGDSRVAIAPMSLKISCEEVIKLLT